MEYMQLVDTLQECLNLNVNRFAVNLREEKAKENKQIFANTILSLKNEFGVSVTTYFLRNLVKGNERQQSKRVYFMLSECGFKTTKEDKIEFYKVSYSSCVVEITEYRKVKTEKDFFKTCGAEIENRLIKSQREQKVLRQQHEHAEKVFFIVN